MTSIFNIPDDFKWGISTSEYQISGAENCPDSDWAHHESQPNSRLSPSGKALDHWNEMERDVALLKKLGVNSYRFSLEWSKIEPQKGEFDQSAIDHYIELCRLLRKNNIEPMITLHHFTNPQWFAEEGGFENEENIQDYVDFCTYVFKKMNKEADLWVTINEPAIYAFMGYVLGKHPPFRFNLQQAGTVLSNLLKAHCRAYQALKQIRPDAQIGLVHNVLQFETHGLKNPLEKIPAELFTRITHQIVMEFFAKKESSLKYPSAFFPFLANVDLQLPKCFNMPQMSDFFGVNYYTKPLLKAGLQWPPVSSTCRPGQEMTSYEYRFFPEGIYEAIQELNAFNLPIYITETGTPDSDHPARLKAHFDEVIKQIDKACGDGMDIRGFYPWSAMDNYEWSEGYEIRFGLAKLNHDQKSYTIKKGTEVYTNAILLHQESKPDKTA